MRSKNENCRQPPFFINPQSSFRISSPVLLIHSAFPIPHSAFRIPHFYLASANDPLRSYASIS